jgi:signal transduction histidine kinase
MVFVMNRNIRLGKDITLRALELEKSNKTIQSQQAELEQANVELKKLDKLKDEFISIASHELKNPIQPILLTAELGKRGKIKEDQAFDTILQNAKRLRQLASDILDASKIESQNLTCIMGKVGIRDLVSEAAKAAAMTAGSNIRIDVSIDQDVDIEGDRMRLLQVFSNLLNNAIKFTAEGYIRIQTRTYQDKIEINITDTGTGIPADILPNLFGKFVSSSSDQRNRHGSGLGLYIVKAIITAHKGEVTAQNNEDRGSTFTISLPMGDDNSSSITIDNNNSAKTGHPAIPATQ